MKEWGLLFGWTVVLEVFVIFILTHKKKIHEAEFVIVFLIANLATHPFLFVLSKSDFWTFGLLPLELFAVLIEAIVYFRFKFFDRETSLAASLMANGISLGLGTLLL